MRTFVALELPERFAIETAALSHKLETTLEGRFLPPCTHHLTLAFLGEVGEPEVAAAIDALEEACAGTSPLLLRSEDVYKRQGRQHAVFHPVDASVALARLVFLRKVHRRAVRTRIHAGLAPDAQVAVSYTHLDVYKRQVEDAT